MPKPGMTTPVLPPKGDKFGNEQYSVNQRIRGGSYASRLNPAIVSSHINADIGAKHLPMPMVHKTGPRTVPQQDLDRLERIEILSDKFKNRRGHAK
jgi:hypothetical protein